MWDELEIDPAFTERDAFRKAGRPVEIARTVRLLIRETILSDVPELYRIGTLPEIAKWIRPMQKTLEEELEYTKAYIRHAYAFYDYGLWTLTDEESGRIVGRAGLMPSEILHDAVEVGYMIAPEYQKRGLAAEAAEAILDYAEHVLNLDEIHLLTLPYNTASVRIAEKSGFVLRETVQWEERDLLHYIWRVDV